MVDIRETLIRNANYRFSMVESQSVLTYKMFLFFLFKSPVELLVTQEELAFTFKNKKAMLKEFQEFEGRDCIRSDGAIGKAEVQLDDMGLFRFRKFKDVPEEDLEDFKLDKSDKYVVYFDVANLVEEYIAEPSAPHDQATEEFFTDCIEPTIEYLCELTCKQDVALNAFLIALSLILILTPDDFAAGEMYILTEDYKDFAERFSAWASVIEKDAETVRQNLVNLEYIGFISISKELPDTNKFLVNEEMPGDSFNNHVIKLDLSPVLEE